METLIEDVGKGVEIFGVIVLLIGIVIASLRFVQHQMDSQRRLKAYEQYRLGLGRSLLLGLEILVAGDVIRTVAVKTTFESVGLLALIVLIRTFLSWALEVELNGQWPWRAHQHDQDKQKI